MNNQELLQLDLEFSQFNSAHRRLNRGKMKQFYTQFGGLIDMLKKKANMIQDDYFVIEDKKIKFEGEGKDMKPVFKEGKTMEEYNSEYNRLMIIPVPD